MLAVQWGAALDGTGRIGELDRQASGLEAADLRVWKLDQHLPSQDLRRYVESQVMQALPEAAGVVGQTEGTA